MGLGIYKTARGSVGLANSAWSRGPGRGAESPQHTAVILKANKRPVFPQTGLRDGAAWPEQLGGGWWQEAA